MGLEIKKVKAILFDIDGTLSDTDDRLVEKVAKVFSPFFRSHSRKLSTARWIVMALESPGNFIYNLTDRFDLDSFFIRQLHRMTKERQLAIRPYWLIPGISEMLQSLSRFPLGVVSARDEVTSLAFLQQFDLEPYFDVVVSSQTCRYTKPFPDPLIHAAKELQVDPQACLMVGDTTVDIKAAKLAGMQALGVLCGFGREKELRRAGADDILASTADLKDLFRNERSV